MTRRHVLLAAGAAAMLAAWAAALVLLPFAPLLIGTGVAAACLVAMLIARTAAARAVWFNVAFIAVAVGLFDARVGQEAKATAATQGKQQYFGNPADLFITDDVLGVRPKPGLSTTARMTYRGEEVYDVVYSFDEAGLRISPPEDAGSPQDCVLFFGDSYMFGEGVDDDETLPYRVGVRADGRFIVRNFGFPGYGPHQMLAALESGFVERAARCRPRHAVFQTEYHHTVRAAGIWTWDKHGPRYVLGEDGRPVRAGNFDSEDQSAAVLRALEKSAVATELRKRTMEAGAGDATEADVKLYLAIVGESLRRIRETWPDIEFHVIYWDVYESLGRYPLFEGNANIAGLTVHPISKILPPSDDPVGAYKLRDEVHPNPRAHDLIAAYVVREILHVTDE